MTASSTLVGAPAGAATSDAPVGIWGYSQGGQAAAAAAEQESTYAPELDVVGVAAGGIPADLNVVAENLNTDGNFWFTFLAFAAVGLDAAYPELDLDSYLNQTGRDMLAAGRNACLVDGLLLGSRRHIEDVTTTVIPYNQATALRDAWCARGTNLQWRDYPSDTHASGEFTATTDVVNWLNARFTNQPPTPTCNT